MNATFVAFTIAAPGGCIREVPLAPPWPPPEVDGAYVTAVEDCERGCDEIKKGAIILAIDDKPVFDAADVEAMGLTDGRMHRIELRDPLWGQREVILVAHSKPGRVPSSESSPLRTIATKELARTPELGQMPLWGHASPAIELVDMDGNSIDGRSLCGQRRLIVYWDADTQSAARVLAAALQQALLQLRAHDVDVMFAYIFLPWRPMNPLTTAELRDIQREWGISEHAGASIRFHRLPNNLERNPRGPIGLGNINVLDNLVEAPAIVMLDNTGIVRWHSKGLDGTSEAAVEVAIQFALEVL